MASGDSKLALLLQRALSECGNRAEVFVSPHQKFNESS